MHRTEMCRGARRAGAKQMGALSCVLLWAAPALAWAQPDAGAEQAVPSPSCTRVLDGHVVDDSTHEPIAGAEVRRNGEYVTLTDGDGRFILRGLCPGPVEVEVQRPDYEAGRRTVVVGGATSLEMELRASGNEIYIIKGKDIERPDMRATAVIAGEALERTRGRSFSDALAEVPGVGQLRSASGMAKPIVRGQFGRRLLLLVDAVPHRSQEWGLDHAPEIDPFIADELKVVRGAAGVRYGPGAIGGAVIASPPELLSRPGMAGEAHLMGFFARGGGLAARLQAAPEQLPGFAYQIEGTGKRLTAASTPDYALQNTGSLEWNLGASAGYRTDKGEYMLSYRHYQARLGVCACLQIESSEDFFAQLERGQPINAELFAADLEIERPYQSVAHDQLLARSSWSFDSLGKLTTTYALQFDHRREFDVVRTATGPQFDFRLTTHDVDVVLAHRPVHLSNHWHLRGSLGAVGMAQVHSYRGLPLVPDYQAAGAGLFAIERLIGHDIELEAGLRYDALARTASLERNDFLRLVRSEQLAMDACGGGVGDSGQVDCDSLFHTISGSVGALFQLSRPWSVKLDLSTASRPPNPDEQYLNGTSPTFPVLGLGKPDLGPETTYSASATTVYQSERLAAEFSAYANLIDDYINFAPAISESGQPIFDVLIRGSFPRFVTQPVDAVFYGADGGVAFRPIPGLELGGQFSIVRARNRSDDSFLVLVPGDRLRGSATYTHTASSPGPLENAFATIAGTLVARQNRFNEAADLAAPPPGYFLLDAELGAETQVRDHLVKLAVHGTNLLDARYRDYTSLLRYFADQQGTQIMLRLSFHFSRL
jgi:iron complex outermembrane recepter protein